MVEHVQVLEDDHFFAENGNFLSTAQQLLNESGGNPVICVLVKMDHALMAVHNV